VDSVPNIALWDVAGDLQTQTVLRHGFFFIGPCPNRRFRRDKIVSIWQSQQVLSAILARYFTICVKGIVILIIMH
jgi:hypothetical protein